MKKIQDAITEILKTELEYADKDCGYSQWVLGVSIKKDRSKHRIIGSPTYIARVVVKTNESPFVDGMDVLFTLPEDDVIIELNYYENTPEFQGGSVESSLKWLAKLEDIYYLQLDDPGAKGVGKDE